MSDYIDNVYEAMLEYVTAKGGSWKALADAMNRGDFGGTNSAVAKEALTRVYARFGNNMRYADEEGAAALSRIINNPNWTPTVAPEGNFTASYGNPGNLVPREAGPENKIPESVYEEVKADARAAEEAAAENQARATIARGNVGGGLVGAGVGAIVGSTAIAAGQVIRDALKQIAAGNKLEKGPLRPIGALPKQPSNMDTYDSLLAELHRQTEEAKKQKQPSSGSVSFGEPPPIARSRPKITPIDAEDAYDNTISVKNTSIATTSSASTPSSDQGASAGSAGGPGPPKPSSTSTGVSTYSSKNVYQTPDKQSLSDWAKSWFTKSDTNVPGGVGAAPYDANNWFDKTSRVNIEEPTEPEVPGQNATTEEKEAYGKNIQYYAKEKGGFIAAKAQERKQFERGEKSRVKEGEQDEEDVNRDYERTALTSLRPFLADAGADMFDDDEDTDRLKEQKLLMGMTKPPNWPLGNLDNKLWLQNICHEGLIQAPPLFVMPPIYKGGNLTEGAQIFGTYQHVPRRQCWKPTTFTKRLRVR